MFNRQMDRLMQLQEQEILLHNELQLEETGIWILHAAANGLLNFKGLQVSSPALCPSPSVDYEFLSPLDCKFNVYANRLKGCYVQNRKTSCKNPP